LILATLVAHFLLVRTWTRVVFVAVGILIMVVKNGIRIATLTMLAQYVDPGFLYGRLHHDGGIVFFLIGLGLLVPVYWVLQRLEKQSALARG
jgi:exosortase/archaeosortase family protein